MVHRYWLPGLTALGLVLVLGPLEASARQKKNPATQPKNPTAAQQKAAQKAAAEQQKAQLFQAHLVLLGELHHVHYVLAAAKHDYNGLRVKAMGQVQKAINALHSEISHHHKHFNAKTHTPPLNKTTPKSKGSKETQAISDVYLQHAITGLQTVYTQLAGLPKGPHHAQVGKELTTAVNELHAALKIR